MSMAQREGSIWVNGDFGEWDKANFPVLTHSLHLDVSFGGTTSLENSKRYSNLQT